MEDSSLDVSLSFKYKPVGLHLTPRDLDASVEQKLHAFARKRQLLVLERYCRGSDVETECPHAVLGDPTTAKVTRVRWDGERWRKG